MDFVRLLISFFTWNVRKSLFRLRPAKCPCQAAGDSGRAGETRCEAAMEFDKPARFRWVCPALKPTENGLRCSLNRKEVRPYWGRVFLLIMGLAVIAYVAGTTAWWGALRTQGFQTITLTDCLLCNHESISDARTLHFKNLGFAFLERGDIGPAINAFSSAQAVSGGELATGLLLARLMEHARRFAEAESVYRRLSERYPAHRQLIDIEHADAMLMSQRLVSLLDFAVEKFMHSPAERDSWFLLLLKIVAIAPAGKKISVRNDGSEVELSAMQRTALRLATAENEIERKTAAHSLQTLAAASPLEARYRWELLASSGYREAARKAILKDQRLLGVFESNLGLAATIDPRVDGESRFKFWLDLVNENEMDEHQIERLVSVGIQSGSPLPLSLLRTRIASSEKRQTAALWVAAVWQDHRDIRRRLEADLDIVDSIEIASISRENLLERLFIVTGSVPIPREILLALTMIQPA